MQRVDFYVLDSQDARERLRFACRVIDKAFQAEHRVLVWCQDGAELQALDDLLWSFAQDSFIPHEPASAESSWDEAPVLLSHGAAPPSAPDVLINLAAGVPPLVSASERVLEIIDADPARRQSGRARFKQYRDQGVEPTTHNIATGAGAGG
ncbi:MAG: DNA polymerase III subunit chi [Steroidobacteraceae bacterium]